MTAFLRRRPLLLSLLTAVLLWSAYPGGGEIWPLLSVALVPMLVALPEMSSRRSFIGGLATGTLLYLLLLYWIVIVLGRYGGLPFFVSIPALVLLAVYMSVYLAGFAYVARILLTATHPMISLFAIPALWVGLDWLRSVMFSGFPWMDIGYALAGNPKIIQIADLFGHGGVSFVVVFVNTLVALILLSNNRLRCTLQLGFPAALLLVLTAVYSVNRWASVQETLAAELTDSIVIGVVQGNIDQSVKWAPLFQHHTITTYVENSKALFVDDHPDLLVWPETALPLYLQTYRDVAIFSDLVKEHDTALLTGAPWFEIIDRSKKKIKYFNSAQLLNADGSFGGSYYKSHLVPFGEYVPLKKLLPFLAPLVEAVGDFSPGVVGTPLEWRGAKAGVLVCFESIFPDIAREWVLNGANVLVNLTNDAWYGKSSAPYHSMAMTVFRAVETRRSVVRSANTGISGFIDPLGRVEAPSEIFTTWAGAERVALLNGKTHYVRWGHWFAPGCFAGSMLLLTVFLIRRKKTTPVD